MMRFAQCLREPHPGAPATANDLEAERRGDYDPPLSPDEELLVYGFDPDCKEEG